MCPSARSKRWFLLAALGAFNLLSARGELIAPVRSPPQPVPINVQVWRGSSVRIPLRVFGQQGQTLGFKIRTLPESGTLSEPEMVSREVAIVTYQHSGNFKKTRDRFTYAAQSSSGVSAATDVNIRIVDEPSLLIVPEELDFGSSTIGALETKELAIQNRGGGVLSGTLRLEEPWRLQGSPAYKLGPGQWQTFKLVFDPQTEGEARRVLRYSSNSDRSTLLHAKAIGPIAVSAEAVDLKTDGKEPVRRGKFAITNRTPTKELVRIETGERLHAPAEVEIEPNGVVTIALETAPEDLRELEQVVKIIAPGYATSVLARAETVPPILRTNTASLSMEKTNAGEAATARVEIENIGGPQAFGSAEISTPFTVAPATFSLAHGEKIELAVGLDRAKAGKYRTWLKVHSYESAMDILIDAEVVAEKVGPVPAASSKPQTLAPPPSQEVDYSDIPAIDDLDLVDVGATTARLAWTAPEPGALQYKIEMRTLSLDAHDDDLRIGWIPLANFRTEPAKDQVTAEVRRLRPQTFYTIRVSALRASGPPSAPSRELSFTTHPGSTFFKITPLKLLFLVLMALLVGILWRRFAPEEKPVYEDEPFFRRD